MPGAQKLELETQTYGFPGLIAEYGGAAAPTGWLLCDGASYLRASYAALFAILGTTYGSADGTHFNVPDMRGRIPIGVGTGTGGGAAGTGLPTGGAALTAVARAGWKGEETHQLSTAELASHNHTQNAHGHTQDAHNHTQDAHQHTMNVRSSPVAFGTNVLGRTSTATNDTAATVAGLVATNQAATATNQNATPTNNAAGSDTAHNNIQPVMGVNFIIKQ